MTFVQYQTCKSPAHFRFDTILLDKADACNFEVFRISCKAIICCLFLVGPWGCLSLIKSLNYIRVVVP